MQRGAEQEGQAVWTLRAAVNAGLFTHMTPLESPRALGRIQRKFTVTLPGFIRGKR